jgi:hypothetical protein
MRIFGVHGEKMAEDNPTSGGWHDVFMNNAPVLEVSPGHQIYLLLLLIARVILYHLQLKDVSLFTGAAGSVPMERLTQPIIALSSTPHWTYSH